MPRNLIGSAVREAGRAQCKLLLGDLFAQHADPPNLDAARYWWEQAAASGHPDAARRIAELG
jgi:TPR repeat protein